MTQSNTAEESPGVAPIVDHESLQNNTDIPFHEDHDVVEESVVEQVAELGDLAAVGVTNRDGDLLLRRATETCSWKIPVETVDPADDYAAAIRTRVENCIGFSLELDSVVGVWDIRVETDDGTQTASRAFVTFSAVPGEYDLETATPTGDPVEEAGWFSELPAEASKIPGTDLFLEG